MSFVLKRLVQNYTAPSLGDRPTISIDESAEYLHVGDRVSGSGINAGSHPVNWVPVSGATKIQFRTTNGMTARRFRNGARFFPVVNVDGVDYFMYSTSRNDSDHLFFRDSDALSGRVFIQPNPSIARYRCDTNTIGSWYQLVATATNMERGTAVPVFTDINTSIYVENGGAIVSEECTPNCVMNANGAMVCGQDDGCGAECGCAAGNRCESGRCVSTACDNVVACGGESGRCPGICPNGSTCKLENGRWSCVTTTNNRIRIMGIIGIVLLGIALIIAIAMFVNYLRAKPSDKTNYIDVKTPRPPAPVPMVPMMPRYFAPGTYISGCGPCGSAASSTPAAQASQTPTQTRVEVRRGPRDAQNFTSSGSNNSGADFIPSQPGAAQGQNVPQSGPQPQNLVQPQTVFETQRIGPQAVKEAQTGAEYVQPQIPNIDVVKKKPVNF